RYGKIVNVGSMGGRLTFPGGGFYHATKHALEAISDALRFEVRGFGIDVILLEPGLIVTEFGEAAGASLAAVGGEDTGSDPYADFNAVVGAVTKGAYEEPKRARIVHVLGDRARPDRARKRDQRGDNTPVTRRAREPADESSVDLQVVEVQMAQVLERSKPGAEVVERDLAAEGGSTGTELARCRHVRDRGGLGDLEHERLAADGVMREALFEKSEHVLVGQRERRKVHRDGGAARGRARAHTQARRAPRELGQSGERFVEHRTIDPANQL